MSASKIKKLDGINKKAKSIVCYLIGQLGKNDLYKDEIDGDTVLNYALELIDDARQIVGKKSALVECEDNVKLKVFYERNGFECIGKSEETGLLSYVRLVNSQNKKV